MLLMPIIFPMWVQHKPNLFHQAQIHTMTWMPLSSGKFSTYLSAILSIQSMLFLGFVDDVMNVRWRHKLPMPAIASLPLLLVYILEGGLTTIVVPSPLRPWLGSIVDLGILYYIYMIMVAIFCTNSINILAGINGVEVGQALIIALTLIGNSIWNYMTSINPVTQETHLFSLILVIPFTACSWALFQYNRYPARVFVGDTFTYFAGMVFAVTGILGHFSKTLLLFFLPQIFNFLFSVPQLFRILPCPRHRLPSISTTRDRLTFSICKVPTSKISKLGYVLLCTLQRFGLVNLSFTNSPIEEKSGSKPVPHIEFSNLTLINYILVFASNRGWQQGLHERQLANLVIYVQVFGSIVGLGIRYGLAGLVYS
jgi:UDP-N-acetylglucosamine--dolichyl-phosphate N-acetylglucosaminephosphotransferase